MTKDELDLVREVIQETSKKEKKLSGVGKFLTLLLVAIITLFGILGSFDFMGFNMAYYTMFLDKFALILSVLIGSVGIGIATKKVAEVIKKKNEQQPGGG